MITNSRNVGSALIYRLLPQHAPSDRLPACSAFRQAALGIFLSKVNYCMVYLYFVLCSCRAESIYRYNNAYIDVMHYAILNLGLERCIMHYI